MSYDIEPSEILIFFGLRFLSHEPFDEQTDPRARAAEEQDLSS